jgi:hypothetical protein
LQFEQLELVVEGSSINVKVQYANEITKRHQIPLQDFPSKFLCHLTESWLGRSDDNLLRLKVKPSIVLPHLMHFDTGLEELVIETDGETVKLTSFTDTLLTKTPKTELGISAADFEMLTIPHGMSRLPRAGIPIKELRAVLHLADSLKCLADISVLADGRAVSLMLCSEGSFSMRVLLGASDCPSSEENLKDNFNSCNISYDRIASNELSQAESSDENEVCGTPPPPRRTLPTLLQITLATAAASQ